MIVYKIKNDQTKECYVGLTIDFSQRVGQHLREAKQERSKNRKLYKAINEYGINNFSFKILEETEDENREGFWLNKLDSFNNGYNETKDGKGNKKLNTKRNTKGVNRIQVTQEMIDTANKSYFERSNLRVASYESKIPERRIKDYIDFDTIRNQKLENKRAFVIIDKKSGEVVSRYKSVSDYIGKIHRPKKYVLDRLNNPPKSSHVRIYKWV